MSTRKLTSICFIISSILLIGCNRGCSTSIGTPTFLESAEKTFRVDGKKIKISAELYRYDKKFVPQKFRLYFTMKTDSFSHKKFTYDIIEDPSLIDIQAEVDKFQIQLSDDHVHLAIGHNGVVDRVYHFFKLKPAYASGLDKSHNYHIELDMDWKDLEINNFTDVEYVLRQNYIHDCGVAYEADDMRLFYLQHQTPSDTLHQYLFDRWPGCQFYTSFLDSAQIETLKVDSNWLSVANSRIESYHAEYKRPEWQDVEVQRLERILKN